MTLPLPVKVPAWGRVLSGDPDLIDPIAPTPPLGQIQRVTGLGLSAALGAVAAVRRGKAVHPHGVTYHGRLRIDGHPEAPAAALLRVSADHAVIVRISRSIGLPRPLPDLLGLSIRVLDAYGPGRPQDLMLISSIDRPVLHHVFVPATDVWQTPYSSSLPFRSGDRRFLLGVLPHLSAGRRPAGEDEFTRLASAVATGRLRLDLVLAALNGRFDTRLGEIVLTHRAPDELDALCFNPWHTGEDLEPAGWLNAVRAEAYHRSQWAWGLTQRDGRRRQRAAHDQLR